MRWKLTVGVFLSVLLGGQARADSLDANADVYFTQPPFFDCAHYMTKYNFTSCAKAQSNWLNHGLRLGRDGSPSFSLKNNYLKTNTVLKEFFGDNYRQAWHFIRFYERPEEDLAAWAAGGFVSDFKVTDINLSTTTAVVIEVDKVLSSTATDQDRMSAAILEARKARNKAQNNGKRIEIRFAGRRYDFACPGEGEGQDGTYCFKANGLNAVSFIGSSGTVKTELVMGNVRKGFIKFADGSDVSLQDLVVDWKISPFIQGKIMSVTDICTTVYCTDPDVRVTIPYSSEGYMAVDDIYYALGGYGDGDGEGNFVLMDGAAPHRKLATHNFIKPDRFTWYGSNRNDARFSFERTNPQLDHFLNEAAEDDQYVYTLRNGGSAFNFQRVGNISLNRVMIYASPSVGIVFSENTGSIKINRLVFRPREGSGRLISASGGGILAQNNRASIEIRDSYFSGLADDSFATSSSGHFMVAQDAVDRRKVKLAGNYDLLSGDRLQIMDPRTGEMLGDYTAAQISTTTEVVVEGGPVMDASAPGYLVYEVKLQDGPEPVAFNLGAEPLRNVIVDGVLRDIAFIIPRRGTDWMNAVVYNKSAAGPGSKVMNNIFGYNRGAASRLNGPDSEASGNVVLLVGTCGFEASNLVNSFILGPSPTNQQIIGNLIYGGTTVPTQHIEVGKEVMEPKNGVISEAPGVVIRGNRLVRPPDGTIITPRLDVPYDDSNALVREDGSIEVVPQPEP